MTTCQGCGRGWLSRRKKALVISSRKQGITYQSRSFMFSAYFTTDAMRCTFLSIVCCVCCRDPIHFVYLPESLLLLHWEYTPNPRVYLRYISSSTREFYNSIGCRTFGKCRTFDKYHFATKTWNSESDSISSFILLAACVVAIFLARIFTVGNRWPSRSRLSEGGMNYASTCVHGSKGVFYGLWFVVVVVVVVVVDYEPHSGTISCRAR